MIKFQTFILQILVTILIVNCEKIRYDNHTLYKLKPKTENQLDVLKKLYFENDKLDFWSAPVAIGKELSVVITPALKSQFINILQQNDIESEISIENIQSVIDQQTVKSFQARSGSKMLWDTYYTLDGIYNWLKDLAEEHPGVVTLIKGGSTYEKRDILGIKISHGSGKKNVFIEGGIHAREWISPATVNYITNELLYSDYPETKAAATEFDWYIFPVTNPDGYAWTHEEDRLWRKNRRPYGEEFGVDLNRNWNSNWGGLGTSDIPSSNNYAGPGPFSEIETRSIATLIEELAPQMELYLSFHSSGQLLLIPYGNTTDPLDNYYDAIKIGRRAMGSLSVRYGTQYTAGNIAEAIYFATGTSMDWVKERLHVPLVYCYELRDRGTYGHLLPADQILPNSEEVMDSLLAMIREAKALEYMNS